jgi:hypothetical protein
MNQTVEANAVINPDFSNFSVHRPVLIYQPDVVYSNEHSINNSDYYSLDWFNEGYLNMDEEQSSTSDVYYTSDNYYDKDIFDEEDLGIELLFSEQ